MYEQKGRFNRDRNDGGVAPVKVGDVVDVKIEAVGEKGDGIAKKNGFVIFVPGAKEGTTVKIRITRVLKKMAFSEIAGEASKSADNQESNNESENETSEEPEDDFSGEDSEDFGEGDKEEKD